MAADLDDFPLDDAIIDLSGDRLFSDIWRGSLSTFMQSLQEYLTQNGIFIPKLTTDQRNLIQTPGNGQMIYNTTTNKFQGYENNVWQNLI